jgi:hypothetical protein
VTLSPETKKGLIYFGISLIVLVLVFVAAFLVHSKTRANNHDENKYGVFRVRLAGEGWDDAGRPALVRQAFQELNRIGPTVAVVESGEHVVVRIDQTFLSSNLRNCYAGLYTREPVPQIKLVPTCMRSGIEFQSTLMHEVGHALGMQHICRKDREVADCSPVGHQVSIMNPGLDYSDSFPSTDVTNELDRISSVPMVEITGIDVQEFKRVWNGARY